MRERERISNGETNTFIKNGLNDDFLLLCDSPQQQKVINLFISNYNKPQTTPLANIILNTTNYLNSPPLLTHKFMNCLCSHLKDKVLQKSEWDWQTNTFTQK